jgi:hypothetical protein
MTGASFDGLLNADSVQVGGMLLMRSDCQNKASFKDVVLRSAKIDGNIDMTGASFDGSLNADSVHVGGSLDLPGATFLAVFNLSGASVAGNFALGVPGKLALWKGKNGELGTLNLRNTPIGNLKDATEAQLEKDAWPEKYTDPTNGHLHLDGFTFDHIERTMRDRGMPWWDDWARRDPDYSPTPYAQLAAASTSSGDRDAANEIRYLGREREHQNQKNVLAWVWSGFLQYVVGFGIGIYTFRVLGWTIIISLFGALYLKERVVLDGGHGFF